MTTTPSLAGAADGLAELDLDALARYLDAHVDGGLGGPLAARLVAGGRSNPTYELLETPAAGDGRSWILRRPPYGEVVAAAAHDMGREARVIGALAGSAVPVPRVVARCEDAAVIGADFYVMEKVEGRTFRTPADTATLTPAERAGLTDSLVDLLVDLHAVDPAAVGLADFGRPDGYLERQLARWQRQWAKIRTRDLTGFGELAARLERSMPTHGRPGIVHGDYKIDNLMVAPDDATRVVALLDWEMATLGDTLADVGMLLSFWDEEGGIHNPITAGATALPGFPDRRTLLATYAERCGIEVSDVEWYVVFADFKLLVILEQIHARHLQGTTVGSGVDDLGPMVPLLLERALAGAGAATDPRLRG
ncbi:MAG TPA: phosphotransferase family protein [Nocardioides sp.]